LSIAYDRRLREIALAAAGELDIELRQGIYVMSGGPTFETPADVRFLRQIGADAVGMSTVPEVVVARHEGMRVLGISHISNVIPSGADPEAEHGDDTESLHQEVLDAGGRVMPRLKMLIKRIIERLGEY
jgi:purine-nucleoside phosphorylase